MKALKDRVHDVLDGQWDINIFRSLLKDLIIDNSSKSMNLVAELADSDYGGITFKGDLQMTACFAIINWGSNGIDELVRNTIVNPSYRNILNVTNILSCVASGHLEEHPFHRQIEQAKILKVSKEESSIRAAREGLLELMTEVEKDDLFPIGMMMGMQFTMNEKVKETFFAAMVARWFHFDKSGVESFKRLIEENHSEQTYHEFIENNNFLLEPFSANIWSKPRFGENLVPDFLIRAIDNTYTVVEIEKPTQAIITKAGNLSAAATHAKRQALDFRSWAIDNHLYAKNKFPEIWRPTCLVIIGLESNLTEIQKEQLRKENESTQGVLKIVGFDWLYNRAKSVFDNIISFGFNRSFKVK
ncbi:Shedu anti-phage system protein SduA domain-containing protein [Hymenobacter armeniacus]|uniref:DUF4263 domain-containing protein n=1 Tax=Hymenobacter armeniacus TaxID=2771358 RepID=A0ABR8JTM9_9BACT|nr:Shedu anti-phage system protein SduA domain-containing protein [Hymenobacter armeniacus]MBD2721975.1 DUF4263 domain-containing protein [Hymenobacter armeniacus]